MLYLKLNLPEETVSYSRLGELLSQAVPSTPIHIKAVRIPIRVTGYAASNAFFAFKLESDEKVFTKGEQLSLLKTLGFLTVPFVTRPEGNQDHLIKLKTQYAQYQPKWCFVTTDVEYKIPEITTITGVSWCLDAKKRLVKVIDTPLGKFELVDHRIPESFQPGLRVKVEGEKISPFMTGSIVVPTPTHCPKCNNPLKSLQLSKDLPLVYKCTSSFCDILRTDTTDSEVVEPEVEAEADNSFREQSVVETAEVQIPEESVPESVDEAPVENTSWETPEVEAAAPAGVLTIVNMEVELPVELASHPDLKVIADPREDVVADFIVTKTKSSITKRSRTLAKKTGIPLIGLAELEEKLNG